MSYISYISSYISFNGCENFSDLSKNNYILSNSYSIVYFIIIFLFVIYILIYIYTYIHISQGTRYHIQSTIAAHDIRR